MYDLQKERENVTDDREIDVDRFVCFYLPVSILWTTPEAFPGPNLRFPRKATPGLLHYLLFASFSTLDDRIDAYSMSYKQNTN